MMPPPAAARVPKRRRAQAALLAVCLAPLLAMLAALSATPALALKAIPVGAEQSWIEITDKGEFLDSRGDNIQVESAPGPDGVAGRMGVKASSPGLSPNWVVFALRNVTNRPIERWLTAERYNVIGSGIVWPDLDSRRLEAVTPSLGFLPDRVKSDRADIFRITLEPGQTVTYVAELASDRVSRIYLWKPLDYELKARERQLFHGILLGITGVLGIFLTAIFAANHKPIFPSAALVTWCVLAYLCVDFGFWHKLFQLRPEDNAVYRAATESATAASLLIFIYIFLRLTASHGIARMLLGVWMIAQIGLIAVAVIDARLAATFARASFAAIGAIGGLATLYLALRGQDRALSLMPTWILLLVWVFAAAMTLIGRLSGEIVVSSLTAGLVLITVLIGFTVTQFAFRTLEPLYGASPSEQQVRSLAIDGAGAAVWEWNARRDEIKTGPLVEMALGLARGELSTKVDDFCNHMYEADRERFRMLLWSAQERGGGEIRIAFRMQHADNTMRWFELEASAVPSEDRRVLRCVGLIREVTEQRRAQERLMHDAVHDSLTGLPNRELFQDRLGVAVTRAKTEPHVCPTVMLIDVDKFKDVNASFGLRSGDSLLLTLARRLQRHLGPQDTLARVGGNQFALMTVQAFEPNDLVQFAERIRRALRSPIKLGGQEIILTAAVGIAVYDPQMAAADDLLKDAEIAMYRAKRGGADRIEVFRPQFRNEVDERVAIESELRVALEKRQLFVLYQPIIQLSTEKLAGYEALVRWKHPRLGMLNPEDFIPIAEESDLIVKLGNYVLSQAVEDAAVWQRLLPRPDKPVFVSVNVSSRQLFRSDLIRELKLIVGRAVVPPQALRFEITESLVMENPERAIEQLEALRATGTGLSLDDFGTGYSSLSYLQRFPFDTIKIDRDLVQASGTDGAGSTIVRSIVALSHELGKKVVAEGVEMQSDVGFLRSIGCEFAQGYYYGGPMPARDVEKMLRQIRNTESKLQNVGFFRTTSLKRKAAPESTRRRPAPAAADAGDGAVSGAGPATASPGPGGAGQRKSRGVRTRPMPTGGEPRGPTRNGAAPHAASAPQPHTPPPAPPSPPPVHAARSEPPMQPPTAPTRAGGATGWPPPHPVNAADGPARNGAYSAPGSRAGAMPAGPGAPPPPPYAADAGAPPPRGPAPSPPHSGLPDAVSRLAATVSMAARPPADGPAVTAMTAAPDAGAPGFPASTPDQGAPSGMPPDPRYADRGDGGIPNAGNGQSPAPVSAADTAAGGGTPRTEPAPLTMASAHTAATANGAASPGRPMPHNGRPNGPSSGMPRSAPDLSTLPPAIAASLAKLARPAAAGSPPPPDKDDGSEPGSG